MNYSQKIVYKMALEKLAGIEAKHNLVSRKALFPDEKSEWAKASDQAVTDLRDVLIAFTEIFNEINKTKF